MSLAETPSFSSMYVTTAGSRSPDLVPITSPSSGVSPIVVSKDLPSFTAVIDEPFPR